MKNQRIFEMSFSTIYPLYRKKIERKGRTKEELDTILNWLTGYTAQQLETNEMQLREFFDKAPQLNPNSDAITGVVCGIRVEDISDPLMQKIRFMDKIVDELAQGKTLEKIMRK